MRIACKAVVGPDPRTGRQFQQLRLIDVPTHRDAIDLSPRIMSVLAESLPDRFRQHDALDNTPDDGCGTQHAWLHASSELASTSQSGTDTASGTRPQATNTDRAYTALPDSKALAISVRWSSAWCWVMSCEFTNR